MISIIVPVYKVEKYLNICVESIMRQTYRDFELILVDDGSPDNCPKLCDKYAEKYKNVIVLHKMNGGLSDARNYGVEHAHGDYVTFIDSDDYVSDDYLQTFIDLQARFNVDVCVGGICTFQNGKKPKSNFIIKEYKYSGIEALENMLYQNTLDTSACALLLSIKLAKKYPFPVGKYHEDEFTTYKYYSSANKVAVTTKSIYFYLQRKNSIMHTFGQTSIDELEAADNLVEVCEKNWPQIIRAAKSKKFSDYCQVLLSTNNLIEEYPDMHKKISSYITKAKYQILFDKKTRMKNRIAAFALLFGTEGLIWLNRIKSR